jgi:hypothetical protein
VPLITNNKLKITRFLGGWNISHCLGADVQVVAKHLARWRFAVEVLNI